jgi:energy-coupling factor transporter ATP-binding protein EcfA2
MGREFIAGGNFSGRSATLHARLKRAETFFLGPYAEAALSGLSSTVEDEIAIYARRRGGAFAPIDWARFSDRKPATLSGGEQVLLALSCFSRSAYRAIAIDTALEQLDGPNRAAALAYLDACPDVALIDNRLDHITGWDRHEATGGTTDYACDLAGMIPELRPRTAPVITIRDMDFAYASDRPIFRNLALSLKPGQAYRLMGRNGAGKTTFFKLLVGVLAPARGAIGLNGTAYDPRHGNRVFALATQNPDHQWCGATLNEDIARRRRSLAASQDVLPASDALLAALASKLGIHSADQHLYELPLAARKRLSWLWPFSGVMPWIMLDEPTIGQDRATQDGLSAVISHLCSIGHGVIVVTHDDEFAARIPHQPLRIEDMTIRAG